MAVYSQQNSKGVTYYLHEKKVVLRGGREQTIYFFAKNIGGNSGKETPLEAVPGGRVVAENPRNGLLTLRRKEA